MSFIYFVLILSFLVIIHELGHFLVAKWSKMKVEEFGVGYPPRMMTLYTDKHGTEYTLNWLPFGGFVRLYGENGPEDSNMDERVGDGAFFDKPVLKRLAVVLAGAIVNFAFGAIAFGTIYTKVGIPTDFGHVLIEEIAEASPAQTAGLMAGDRVQAIVSGDVRTEVEAVSEFIDVVSASRGEVISLELVDVPELKQVYVRTSDEIPEGQGSIGVVVADFAFEQHPIWQMPFRGMWVGVQSAADFGWLLLNALGDMFGKLVFQGEVPDEVAGPVGIVHAVERDGILDDGLLAVLNFAAILSINLAIVNVLPFPALDGGRAVFLVWEWITGKRVKPDFERKVNTVGFASLLLLIVLISVRDIRNVFADDAVRRWFSGLLG